MNGLLQSRRRGAAIPLALVAVMMLLAMGVGLMSLGLSTRVYSARSASAIAARCAADAGLTRALFEMNEKLKIKPWNDSSLPGATNESLPGCNAAYSYTIEGDPVNGYTVESTRVSGEVQKQVTCILKPQGPFEFAVFADQDLELKNSAVVDWYNFGADDEILKIGTNSIISGAIVLKSSSTVNGNVVVGVDGNFEGKNSSAVNNLTENAKKLQIYCLDSCDNMTFKNSSDFYGVIYAPNANVVMDNSAKLYGAVVAETFEQRNSGTFSYDVSLRDAGVNDEAVRFVITNWHEQ